MVWLLVQIHLVSNHIQKLKEQFSGILLCHAAKGLWKQLHGEVMSSWKTLVHLEQVLGRQTTWQGHCSFHPSSAGCRKRQLLRGQNKSLVSRKQKMKNRNGQSQTGITSKTLRQLSHLDLCSVTRHIILDGTPDQLNENFATVSAKLKTGTLSHS